ncbi:MAG: hypothetical protein F4X19_10970 [Acidobacteria bacterium]|nr:hypothetical protein [Acidobacteriota bacterium]
MNTARLVSKVWNFCTTLRDDGVSYRDYLDQFTYLIFIEIANEHANPPTNACGDLPKSDIVFSIY